MLVRFGAKQFLIRLLEAVLKEASIPLAFRASRRVGRGAQQILFLGSAMTPRTDESPQKDDETRRLRRSAAISAILWTLFLIGVFFGGGISVTPSPVPVQNAMSSQMLQVAIVH